MKNVFATVLVLGFMVSSGAFAKEGNGDVGTGGLLKVEGIVADNLYRALFGDPEVFSGPRRPESETIEIEEVDCQVSIQANRDVEDGFDYAHELPFHTCDYKPSNEETYTGYWGGAAAEIMGALEAAGVKAKGDIETNGSIKVKKVSCTSDLETQQGDPNLAPEILAGKASCEIQL